MATADEVVRPDHAVRRGHFIFGDEHDALRETVRAFALRELAPHAEEWEETTFPDAVFRRMGELGFLGLDKPERYGGQGGDYYASLVLAEELAHSRSGGLTMGVAVHTDMAIPPILAFGTERQKQDWVVPAIAGTKILCLGITEPDAGSDVAAIKTRAVPSEDGSEYVINGSKTYITNGLRADAIILVTKTDPGAGHDGFTLFLVPMDLPGVIREQRLEKLGMHASDTALLAFQDVRVPAGAVLGEVGKGFFHIMWELQGERLISAASSVATAQLCFDRTLEYALTRNAFGRQIGHFQAIRHKFAEMATKLESARQMVYATAWHHARGDYPVREISMAKLHASRIAVEVADDCIQIHGGAGYMKEYGIERVWRDLRLNRIGAGTDEIMLDVIGRSYGL
ncbi:MAG: citronellyl-CoA dehydrogenase [Solirubrobacteraceae bacterium]|jgi:alkylation response protein AidB-like acyl-CoA dehydrogenase|nr:citronellyl-CoA dehydrogenase [Solirubrobacteraceae bacterium]